jgi:alpha-ribazole phosphatase
VKGGITALPAGDVIVVAHAGTIRAALALALELSPDKALSFVIDPWSLTRLDRLDKGWRVVSVNRI